MAYVTGSASSLTDLLTAIQNACTANGWALNGNVLSKGACFTSLTISGTDIRIQGGTGIDGSNALTTPGPAYCSVGATNQPLPMTFPVTYHIHVLIDPDEVYVWLNFGVTNWQWLAFGLSPAAGLTGTGGWYAAPINQHSASTNFYLYLGVAGAFFSGTRTSGVLFAQNGALQGGTITSYIHHGLDGGGWSADSGLYGLTPIGAIDAWGASYNLQALQPSAWNSEAVLLPIQVMDLRASSKLSLVADLGHGRYVRNDNYVDGEIITLGTDHWAVYPFAKKNALVKTGSSGGNVDSGTFAIAIRYDGP